MIVLVMRHKKLIYVIIYFVYFIVLLSIATNCVLQVNSHSEVS